ncbi:MAG: DUF1800 family protein [Planctomycetota bacterium]
MSKRIVAVFLIIGCAFTSSALAQADVHECAAPGLAFGGTGTLPVTVSSNISVTTAITIAEAQVYVDVAHEWVGDVVCDVMSPLGTTVRLHDGGGGNAQDLRLLFSDAGVANGSAPYNYGCDMQASGPGALADFDGQTSAGTWTLTLLDNYPTEDDGSFDSWCLRAFAAVPAATTLAPTTLYCAPGNNEVTVSWDAAAQLDSIAIYVDGAFTGIVPAVGTSATVPVTSTAGAVEVCIEGIVTGSAPSCRTCCTVQWAPVTSVELCSQPNLDFGGTGGTPSTISDTITLSTGPVIGDVAIGVDMDHAWIGDVLLDVVSPLGTTVRLHDGDGGQATDIRTTYSDRGAANGAILYDSGCPMQPSGPGSLGDFTGEASIGAWMLAVEDNYPQDDNGALNSWCVEVFDLPTGSAPPPVSGLTCTQSTSLGQIELEWTNGAPYDEVRIEVDGIAVAVLPGSSTMFTTAAYPDGSIIDFTVRGSSAGSIGSCAVTCTAEITFGYQLFVRGDANADAGLNISDAVAMLSYLFSSGDLGCHDAADANDDDSLNVADPVYLLSYLFSGGSEPPAPHDVCGADPTLDTNLTCQSYPPCLGFTDDTVATHVLRRMAYGPTQDAIQHVLNVGVQAYIEEQLDPLAIDETTNTQMNSLLAGLNPQSDHVHLTRLQLIRGLYSERQLQEQLTDFWENHFSTYIWTLNSYFGRTGQQSPANAYAQAVAAEARENARFRDNALNPFEDLLVASMTSPAMLIYLDSVVNIAGNANENYARELLELHTMGVDNGYTQADIEELARVFTGWTVCKVAPADVGNPHAPCLPLNDPTGVWDFHFEPANHDYTVKTLFPGTSYTLVIPAGTPLSTTGVDEGLLVAQHLSQLPQTAEFVSRKLIKKFVSDTPPLSLVAACIGTWTLTGGDIEEVTRTILTSTEFLGTAHRWDKIRTGQENMLATVRAFAGASDATSIVNTLGAISNLPFQHFTPDGYPEEGFEQLGTSRILERIRFHSFFYAPGGPTYDLVGLLNAEGISGSNATAIAEFFWQLMCGSNYNSTDIQLAADMLNTDILGNPSPLNPAAPDYTERLGLCAALIASSPQGMQQ